MAIAISAPLIGQAGVAGAALKPANEAQSSTAEKAGTILSPADGKALLLQIRKAYYSLKDKGMAECRFEAVMDYDAFYKDFPADPVRDSQIVPIIKKMKFQVVVGPTGASYVSHWSDAAPANEDIAERLRQTAGGSDQIIVGFFHTWSGFAIAPTLPEPESQYTIEDTGSTYLIKYKDQDSDVTLTYNHDLAITQMAVNSSSVTGSVNPTLTKTDGGYLMTGYEAIYKTPDGGSQHITITIDNTEVDGLQVPKVIHATMDLGSRHIAFPITFINAKTVRR